MQVSIIIVSYNTKELTRKCIESIVEHTTIQDYEIIVVDNKSSDGSQEMLKREYPFVVLVENHENIGFGNANNIAIKLSKAKYVFLLNPDTILLNDAVKIFYEYMEKESNAKVWCCGGLLLSENGDKQNPFGYYVTLKEIFIKQLISGKLFEKNVKKKINMMLKGDEIEVNPDCFVCGADMFIRKSVIDQYGYFNPKFFLYFEEAELCYRIGTKGFKSVILKEAIIIHYFGQSTKNMNIKRMKMFIKSEFIFIKECYGTFSYYISKVIYYIGFLFRYIIYRDSNYIDLIKYLPEL